VIPCLNEEENIERCVRAALEALRVDGPAGRGDRGRQRLRGRRSAELAEQAGARVVVERRRGYGSAYLAGFAAARGAYIVMADADLTYDFDEIPASSPSSTRARRW
jgi:glycosyltransferase involved in cell wall biosynthesis